MSRMRMAACALGALTLALTARPAAGDGEGDLQVLGNHLGETAGYTEEALRWYEQHLPTLPADWAEQAGFVAYAPVFPYLDEVNWSLLGLAQFAEIGKARWVRLPEGQQVRRDPATGAWAWPVGTETAKLLRARTLDADGHEVWTDLELRLARKLRDGASRDAWTMGLYVRGADGSWVVVRPPALRLDVPRAKLPGGGTRSVLYTLTPPEGCMTCHSRASQSPVDLRRGNEYVYGANDELLTGRARVRLSQWLASDELRAGAHEVARDEAAGWVEVQTNDLEAIRAAREAFAPLIAGELPPAPR